MKRITLLFTALFIVNFAFGQIPNIIPYQGQISNKSGTAYDGNFTFQFEILDNTNSSLWSSGNVTVAVHNGLYTAHLGENPQPALPKNVFEQNITHLKISFNDGVNGLETLSPNIQILPVPYALRAAMADSSASSNGQLGWGDSLVLRDKSGDVRFVMNPNTGEFKILQRDTIWYEIETNSPPKKSENQGGSKATQEYVIINGTSFVKYTYVSATWKREVFHGQQKKTGAKDTLSFENNYDQDNCLRYTVFRIRTNSTGEIREVTKWYNCPAGTVGGVVDKAIAGSGNNPDTEEDKNKKTKIEKKIEPGKLSHVTVDQNTGNAVKVEMDAKDSCFVIEANKIVLKTDSGTYIIRINKDGSISAINEKYDVIYSNVSRSGEDGVTIETDKNKTGKFRLEFDKEGNMVPLKREVDVEKKEITEHNISRLSKLIDSVFYFNIYSQSRLDSIKILYHLTRDAMIAQGIGRYESVFEGMTIILEMSPGEVRHQYIDKVTGDTIVEIIEPKSGEIIQRNVLKKVIHLPSGQDKYTEQVIGGNNTMTTTYDANSNEVIIEGPKSHQFDVGANTLILENAGGDQGLIGNLNPNSSDFVGLQLDPTNKRITAVSGGKTTFITDSLQVLIEAIIQTLKVKGNGYFQGNVDVVGNISKGGGNFKIDHPDDPFNKYLYHSFVESPDMMNVYNGNTTTDSLGYDTITMPDYFKTLNRDFRYQLTCIGTFAQAIVLKELSDNVFIIQTNKPNVKVSWQITGIRKDNYAEENRIIVEVEKEKDEKGKLLYPPKSSTP